MVVERSDNAMQPPFTDETQVDLYEVLQVHPKATAETIKMAYRQLAQRYHPDMAGNDSVSARRIREVNAAYSILRDPLKRANYDAQRAWSARGAPPGPHSASSPYGRPPASWD